MTLAVGAAEDGSPKSRKPQKNHFFCSLFEQNAAAVHLHLHKEPHRAIKPGYS